MKLSYNRQLLPIYLVIGCLLVILIFYVFSTFAPNIMVLVTIAWVLIITFLLWFGNRIISRFLNIFYRNHAAQLESIINDQNTFDAMFVQ